MSEHPKLRVLDTREMLTTEPPPLDWLAEGVFARGKLTLFGGREKGGKSLVQLALSLRMAEGGGDIAGIAVKPGRVLLIDAENGEREIHRRLRAVGLPLERAGRFVPVEARGIDLREDLKLIAQHVERYEPDLLLLDSFRALWRGDERDEAQVANALDPLRDLAHDADIAIGLTHHAQKAGSEYRGSTAIGAAVEWVAMLARVEGDQQHRRRLSTPLCRFAPEREDRWIAIESGGDDGPISLKAAEPYEPPRPVRDAIADQIADVLSAEPMSLKQIAEAIKRSPKDRIVRDALDELAGCGEAEKTPGGWRCPVSSRFIGEDTRTPTAQSQNGFRPHEPELERLEGAS